MKRFYAITDRSVSRRAMLAASGASLLLPRLEFTQPVLASTQAPPQRMMMICTDLGMIPEKFFPVDEGANYKLSPYLNLLKDLKQDFTVFSGISHPEVDGGHEADVSFLTAAPHPTRAGFKNMISLDQYAADRMGAVTRFPSLNLRVGAARGDGSLSFSSDGVRMPAEDRPSKVFQSLFVQGSKRDVERQVRRFREGQSLMDDYADRLKTLRGYVGRRDQVRMEQFCTAVRETEQRLIANEQWEQKAKPQVDLECPQDFDKPGHIIGHSRAMYDLAKLALQTDSTRVVTIYITQVLSPTVDVPNVKLPPHALTHQSKLKESREQLVRLERAQMRVFGDLLKGLKSCDDAGGNLLDQTSVLYGSNLSDANRHDNSNLPILLAGGGFRHGRHVAFDRKKNEPLSNLYVSMLNRMGIETSQFGTSTGSMSEIEAA